MALVGTGHSRLEDVEGLWSPAFVATPRLTKSEREVTAREMAGGRDARGAHHSGALRRLLLTLQGAIAIASSSVVSDSSSTGEMVRSRVG